MEHAWFDDYMNFCLALLRSSSAESVLLNSSFPFLLQIFHFLTFLRFSDSQKMFIFETKTFYKFFFFFGFQMAAHCVSKVELSISCSNLLDKDVGSKSDPLCVLLQSVGDDKWSEVCMLTLKKATK